MRTAGTSDAERLRTPESVRSETSRAAPGREAETLLDPYVRANPIPQGCSLLSIQAIAGIGNAGCMVAGLDLGYR